MQPLNFEVFHQYWKIIEPDAPLIDIAKITFVDLWRQDYCWYCQGTRHKVNDYQPAYIDKDKTLGQMDGVVRKIIKQIYEYPNVAVQGMMFEASYKDGVPHGFGRSIFKKCVQISLFRSGTCLGFFKFNFDFKEIYRSDPDCWLEHISGEDFKLGS